MSRRLLQLVIPVTPERRMFRIHDPSVDPDAPGGPLPPVGALISTNREQLWVGSLQEDIDVRLVLEEWDEAPPPCGDAWDEEAKGAIYLRGQLSISMGLAGTAVRGLRLAGGVERLFGPRLRRQPRPGDPPLRAALRPPPQPAQRRVPAGEEDPRGPGALPCAAVAGILSRDRLPARCFIPTGQGLRSLRAGRLRYRRGPPPDSCLAASGRRSCSGPLRARRNWPVRSRWPPHSRSPTWARCLCSGSPVPGVVIATWPWVPGLDVTGVRAPCVRNGIIAYTISETMATSSTVNSEPTMRARGERRTLAGPGRRNAVRQVASPGSSAASRRSISASARCSSIDSAIQLPPRRAPGDYPLTISQEPVFIQLFWLCTSPVFRDERSSPAPSPNAPAQTQGTPSARQVTAGTG